MPFKKPEQLEQKLEELLKSVTENTALIRVLEGCKDPRERWGILEDYMLNHLADNGLEAADWGLYTSSVSFIRDIFFYEMPQKTKMDFGFCGYFKPAYRQRARYFLEGQKGDPDKNWDTCSFGGEGIRTTCNGTSKDICVLLHPKNRIKKTKIY